MDGALPVCTASDVPMPQRREHILSGRRVGIPTVVCDLNKIDPALDEDRSRWSRWKKLRFAIRERIALDQVRPNTGDTHPNQRLTCLGLP